MKNDTISLDADAVCLALDNAIKAIEAGQEIRNLARVETALIYAGKPAVERHRRIARYVTEMKAKVAEAAKPKRSRKRPAQRELRFAL